MELKTARRRTFDVQYIEVTEDNIKDVAEWCGGVVGGEGKDRFVRLVDKNAVNTAQTKAFYGDYVLGSPTGYKKYTKKSFDKSFEAYHTEEVTRDSETGQFTTADEAYDKPDTTEVEKVDIPVGTTKLPADADPS